MRFLVIGLICMVAVEVDGATVKESPLQQYKAAKDEQPSANRIVGGNNADPGEYPWLASLYYKGYFHCGGSILDENTILTAAHCVDEDVEQRNGIYQVVVGDHKIFQYEGSEQVRRVATVIMNSEYGSDTRNKDVAILKLSTPLVFNDRVQKITLVAGIKQEAKYLKRGKCVAIGIGSTDDDNSYPTQVQEVSLTMMSRRFCSYALYSLKFTKYMMCAYQPNKGTCYGDSGGPIMCYDGSNVVQIGVVSFGNKYCATGFNVFARVATLKSWLNTNMQ